MEILFAEYKNVKIRTMKISMVTRINSLEYKGSNEIAAEIRVTNKKTALMCFAL